MHTLQLQKAEFQAEPVQARFSCGRCQVGIGQTYYEFGMAKLCSACAAATQMAEARPKSAGMLRGFVYGLGAALACGIAYAIFTAITKMQVALIAIGAGYVVGQAERFGS